MSLRPIRAEEYLADPTAWDAVIDARSPAEFAEDRLPGAQNWPVLDDDERRIVGTTFKQDSALAARKIGAAMVGRRIAGHLEAFIADKPRDWRPLVYCWRGGQRSGSLAWFLSQIGFRTGQLEGGYKAFRAVVRAQLERLPQGLDLVVLAGRTGSGKTRLLQALAAQGAQVLDLEGLAQHRGSVLGALPNLPQPTQKAFDTRLWTALRAFSPQRPVFVESESAKIGSLRVPESLLRRMREHGRVMRVDMPLAARVALLLEDYAFFFDDVEGFCHTLQTLVELQGRERVQAWQALARHGHWPALFERLMVEHYDPLYDRSMRKHFAHLRQAPAITLADGGPAALQAAVAAVQAQAAPAPAPAAVGLGAS